jgi:hypothetical protein
MLKKVLFSIALLATLTLLFAGLAAAQVTRITPTITTAEQFDVQPTPGVLKSPFALLKPAGGGGTPPAYCNPCLFYGGDFDPSGPEPNGLYNGNTASSATVYVPFTISKGAKAVTVTGLFANIEYYPSTAVFGAGNGPYATDALWSISTGVAAGDLPGAPPESILCSGTDTYADNGASELTFTGRVAFGLYGEYTTSVQVNGCPALTGPKSGSPSGTATYWITVVPECTGSCSPSGFELSYLSDAEDGGASGRAPEAWGSSEPWDESFFVAPDFGFVFFTPAGVACGVGFGCDRFSVGVIGTPAK